MGLYATAVYPLVLVVLAAVVVAGGVTLIWVRAHAVLKWAVTALYIATAIQLLAVIVVMFQGFEGSLPTAIGYLLTSVALLPLLGIGRLGEPEAAALDPDPNRPVLQPDQVARVDGLAAIVIGLALTVVTWRLAIVVTA
jgi:hypothetical protein